LSAIIIFDAVGYFSASGATALSCVVATRANVAIGAGADGQALSPACSTGYTLVGGGCYAIDFRVYLVQYRPSAGKWECQYTNTNAFTSAIRADATCCRVPGR
jgi:hypothetical protein